MKTRNMSDRELVNLFEIHKPDLIVCEQSVDPETNVAPKYGIWHSIQVGERAEGRPLPDIDPLRLRSASYEGFKRDVRVAMEWMYERSDARGISRVA